MPTNNWFKDWFSSPYYHTLYKHRDDTEAIHFIQKLIQHLQPKKGCTMLDVACGKGRHSKALAEMGFDVTGIDLSLPSIQEAKQFEDDQLHFYMHDMRLPFWINYFDIAFNFFTSFGYFKTQREHNNAIRTIAQSLKHNGLFVIDFLNAHYTEASLQKSLVQEIEGTQFHITKWYDETSFYKQIQVIDAGSQNLKYLYTERVAKFTLANFTTMLSQQQLQIQEVFGDYNLGSYNAEKSPRLIIVAKKL